MWSAGAAEGFNEWQSAFLYGTDLLVLALFGLWFLRWFKLRGDHSILVPRSDFSGENPPISEVPFKALPQSLSEKSRFAGTKLFRFRELLKLNIYAPQNKLLFTVLLFAFISIFSAPYLGVGVYRFLKLTEFICLFFYTVHILKRIKFEHAAFAFILGGIFQALIAVAQFFTQHSLGLKLLGESPLAAGRSEVAEFVAFGSRFMRAYGTFPSPNVLAAYLALAILFLIFWHIARKQITQRERIFNWGVIILISFALLLTFSRAPIAAFAVAFAFLLINFARHPMRQYTKKFFVVLAPLFAGVFAMTAIFWPEIYSRIFTTFAQGDFALKERVFFNNLSFQIISDNMGGVGIGNYTLFLREQFWGLRDSLYQPVHNIFLLSFSELGILGGAAFLLFCAFTVFLGFKAVKNNPNPKKVIVFTVFLFVIISGFFDHFYLTLQQGSLMFWITAGMLYNNIYGFKN